MTSAVPTWFLIAQSIAILILTGLVALIAYWQWRTAWDKLRLDLFEKRMNVYDAAAEFARLLKTHAHYTAEELDKFQRDTAGAQFLFDTEIKNKLDLLYERAKRTSRANKDADRLTGEAGGKAAKASEAALDEIEADAKALDSWFSEYLDFGHIKRAKRAPGE